MGAYLLLNSAYSLLKVSYFMGVSRIKRILYLMRVDVCVYKPVSSKTTSLVKTADFEKILTQF